jgi:hypothetical protein
VQGTLKVPNANRQKKRPQPYTRFGKIICLLFQVQSKAEGEITDPEIDEQTFPWPSFFLVTFPY